MKLKSICMLSILVMLGLNSIAQVEIEKTKSTLTGKNTILTESFPSTTLDHFNINFYNYFFGSDAGGNNAKGTLNTVSIEATLEGLDNALAQEITDEAYLYYLGKWKERGIMVKCPTPAEIEATKQYTKDKSKGKAEIIAPGVYQGGNAYAKFITVIPSNAPQVKKEYFGNFVYGNAQFFPTDFKGNVSSANFHLDLNFISFKNGFGSNASIKGTAGLKSNSGGSLVLWSKTKMLAASYTNEGIGGAGFYDTFDNGGAKWKIVINKAKYKALALEMIKKSIDGHFTEYDENLAKEAK